MAAALDEVASGRIPKDRLALKCLYDDMASWPYLQDTEPARPAAAPAAAAAAPGAAGEARDAYAALSQAGRELQGGRARRGRAADGGMRRDVVVSRQNSRIHTCTLAKAQQTIFMPQHALHFPQTLHSPLRFPADSIVKPYIMGKEARAGDKPQTLADLMPDWVGYGTLYGISLIPVMLAVGAVAVIFFSSLR
jgi:hypothetical protein